MYPSNKLDGGEPLFSGDYGECFCHLCGADDSDIADNGAWGSEAVIAWNYQQKRIEALLDELEASEKRIADQRGIILSARKFISEYAVNGDHGAAEFVKILDRAAGIGVKGE